MNRHLETLFRLLAEAVRRGDHLAEITLTARIAQALR